MRICVVKENVLAISLVIFHMLERVLGARGDEKEMQLENLRILTLSHEEVLMNQDQQEQLLRQKPLFT